jgi:electron transfer flavoprotein alpha subunit
MDMPQSSVDPFGVLENAEVSDAMRASGIEITDTRPKQKVIDLTEAERIVVAGRGIRSPQDMVMITALADALGAQVASTRPLIEAGWQDPRRQIGLSGRTVKPRLIITCGVSGSVQFVAGMSGSDRIVAINTDEDAPIFSVAHLGIVGDIYEVVPRLTGMLKRRSGNAGIQ